MGETSLHGYFYLPALGASGASEKAVYDAALAATDVVIQDLVDFKNTFAGGVVGGAAYHAFAFDIEIGRAHV